MSVDSNSPSLKHVWPLLGLLILFACLPLIDVMPSVQRHDVQRVGQILAFGLVPVVALFRTSCFPFKLPSAVKPVLVAISSGGLLSAMLSRQPLWALTEIALMLGSMGLAWAVAVIRRDGESAVDRMILVTVLFICAAQSLRFLVMYCLAYFFAPSLNPWQLLGGFSNLRFYGQFITLSLPLLAAPILMRHLPTRVTVYTSVLLAIWWAIAITSGTRGTWLGMFFAVAWLAFTGPRGRQWALSQLSGFVGGLFLFQLLMTWVPQLVGMPVEAHATDRLNSSLSGRETIWLQAVEMIVAKPLLGFGPMHFADIPNPVAAHPHQAWLQWAAEWGVPSALAVTWLVLIGMRGVVISVMKFGDSREAPDVLRVCLAGSVSASLVQSMVDGVIVMPYTQIWLAVLAGWLFALCVPVSAVMRTRQSGERAWLLALVLVPIVLSFVAVKDFPQLDEQQERFKKDHGGLLQPRFWAQGMIAADK